MARTEAWLVLLAVVTVTGFQISDSETRPMPRGLFDKLVGAVDKVTHEAKDKVTGAVDKVTGAVDKVTSEAKDKVTGAVDKVTGAVDKVTSEAKDKVTGAVDKVTSEAKDKVTGAVDKVTGAVDKVTSEAKDKVTEAVDKVSEKLKAEAELLAKQFKAMDICSCSPPRMQMLRQAPQFQPRWGACFIVKFVPTKMEVRYALTLGGKELLSGGASPNNMAPICVPVPYVPGLTVCLQPYNLSISLTNGLHGCFRVEIQIMTKPVISLALNCINIKKGEIAIEPPTEGPLKGAIPNIKIPLTKH